MLSNCPEGCLYVDWKNRKRKKIVPVDPLSGCLRVRDEWMEWDYGRCGWFSPSKRRAARLTAYNLACREIQKEMDTSIINEMMGIVEDHIRQIKEEGWLVIEEEKEME